MGILIRIWDDAEVLYFPFGVRGGQCCHSSTTCFCPVIGGKGVQCLYSKVQKNVKLIIIFNQAEERDEGSGHFEDYLTDDPAFLPDQVVVVVVVVVVCLHILPDQEEDDYSDEEMSGEDFILEPSSRGNVIRRVSLTLRRSWRPALASDASEEFVGLAANLSGALEGLYKRVPGKQTFTVVSFRWNVLSSLHQCSPNKIWPFIFNCFEKQICFQIKYFKDSLRDMGLTTNSLRKAKQCKADQVKILKRFYLSNCWKGRDVILLLK